MPNPKGTPENLYKATTDRDEPLTEVLTVRVSASMKEDVKAQENPTEFVREAIAEKLDRVKEE